MICWRSRYQLLQDWSNGDVLRHLIVAGRKLAFTLWGFEALTLVVVVLVEEERIKLRGVIKT